MDFLLHVLSTTGVTVVLVSALGWCLRNIIKERLSSSIRHEYNLKLEQFKSNLASDNAQELEKFKTSIRTEYEVIKSSLLRYSERQFDIYNELWGSLCDVERRVDGLWERATEPSLRELAKQLYEARAKVRKSALLIENRHYKELNQILDEFENFRFGNQQLIDLRKANPNRKVNQIDIDDAIHDNGEIKDRLLVSLNQMMACLKRQIVRVE